MRADGLRVTESEISSTRLRASVESTTRPMRASVNIEVIVWRAWLVRAAAWASSSDMLAGRVPRGRAWMGGAAGGGGDGATLSSGMS